MTWIEIEGYTETRTKIEIVAIDVIECITGLDDGSDNQGTGGLQKGMIYGKEYEFKVSKYYKGNTPTDKMIKKIVWEYSYANDEGGLIITAQEESSEESFKLKIDNLEMLGKKISIYAYLGCKKSEGNLDLFCHNRFRHFDRKIIETELNKRKINPDLIEQHSTSLCGTAAILNQVAKDEGALFYKSYLDFFVKGENKINSFQLKPNPILYEMIPSTENKKYPNYSEYSDGTAITPPLIMNQADWIILAGTRSSDNTSYEGESGENWDAINWVSYMEKVVKKIYNASNVEDKTSYFIALVDDYSDTLNEIQSEYENGWNIVMLIDSDMLDDETSIFGCLTNYHWIVYRGDLNIDNSKKEITFSYWCWHTLNSNVKFRRKVFNTNFYGYIKYKK